MPWMKFCLYIKAVVVLAYDNNGAVNQNRANSCCSEGRFTRGGSVFDVIEREPMIYTHTRTRARALRLDKKTLSHQYHMARR